MRNDAHGLFWHDTKHRPQPPAWRPMPAIPDTGWRPVASFWDFPRLDAAPWIGLDCETFDPGLIERGPGWGRGEGHIVGISVAVPERAWYFPIRHTVCPEQNLDPQQVLQWARYYLPSKQPKIGANLLYDIGWLSDEGIKVGGKCYDVQFAEALLDEESDVNLDYLGLKYLRKGKETSVLYQWLATYYGGQPDKSQRKNIYRCPPSLVGPYAEEDALMPPRILLQQWGELASQGLLDVFELETDLIPLLIAMRRAGVTVDIPQAEIVRDKLGLHLGELNAQMRQMIGYDVNVDANESLQDAFKTLGLRIPLHHETGKPSFTKDTLPLIEHPFADLVVTIRKRQKLKSAFIESAILEKNVNGKLHCQFHPLRGDNEGTGYGRFSCTKPNLTQIPSRDEELAPLVRSPFIPHVGHKQWRRYDQSQIEYRFMAHYAVGRGSDELRARYCSNPKTDYHVDAQGMVTRYTGIEIPRKPIKNFNFMMTFGGGKAKMIRTTTTELLKMGSTFKLDADQLYNAYHEALPFSKETLQHYSKIAQDIGYVRTILGRKARFNLWEPNERHKQGEERKPGLPYEQAVNAYGYKIKRASTHKALNNVLQGSGTGDLMKVAMLKLWQSGVLDVVGVPLLTIYDELDFSDEGGNEEAWRFVHHTLQTALTIRVPIITDMQTGANWSDAT